MQFFGTVSVKITRGFVLIKFVVRGYRGTWNTGRLAPLTGYAIARIVHPSYVQSAIDNVPHDLRPSFHFSSASHITRASGCVVGLYRITSVVDAWNAVLNIKNVADNEATQSPGTCLTAANWRSIENNNDIKFMPTSNIVDMTHRNFWLFKNCLNHIPISTY